MTRIRRTTARSVSEMSAVLIIVIVITVSVNIELLTIASVSAFSAVPSRSYAYTKSSLNRSAGFEQNKYVHRQPASTLFAKENFLAIDTLTDTEIKITSESETPRKKETKNNTNGDIQRALAGLVLTLTIATTAIGGFPLPANAGFGPSSGATTTPPPNLRSITTTAAKTTSENAPTSDFNIDLDGKKLRILIDSTLNVRRLEDFSVELDVLVDSLRDSISALTSGDDNDGETTKYDIENNYIDSKREVARQRNAERQKELLKAEILQSQIERQEKSLIKLQSQPYWFNYFAAFVGSTVSTLIMHPVDTIKTRLQVGLGKDGDEEDNDVPWQSQTPHEPATKPRGIAIFGMSATAAASTAKESVAARSEASPTSTAIGNLGDLYEGLIGNLFKEVPPSAIYLGVYESVKYALSPKVAPAYLLLVYLVAGAAGETVGSFIRAPAEAVKSLVQSKAKANALEAAKSVLGTADGRANVLRAWGASICRDVPFGAIQLAAFETIKAAILNNPNIELDSSTLLSEAVIGAFAGGLGALVTNPTDVITTRIITQDPTGDGEGEGSYAPLGVLEMGKKIYEKEGAGAFFTGWEARVGYWAPAISIFLTCYCSVRRAGITYDIFS